MAEPIIIPIDPGDLMRPSQSTPVRGGGSRMVPNVPLGGMNYAPCLIRSRRVVTKDSDGREIPPSNECILLLSRDPYATLRAYIEVAAWPSFHETPLEW